MALGVLAAPGAAFAWGGGSGGQTGDPQKVTVDVIGWVPGHCGFTTAPAGKTIPDDLSMPGSLRIDFAVNCNTPFRVRAVSAHGGLLADHPSIPGFSNRIDYSLRLTLATDAGGLDATCNADALTSGDGGCAFYGAHPGQGLSSGDGVAINKAGALQFGWGQGASRLIAGAYSDTLTIVVEARI